MRSLLAMLAVLVVFLALVLRQFELYLAAGMLTFLVLLSWIVPWVSRLTSDKKVPPAISEPSEDSLDALGILSIKAVDSSSGSPEADMDSGAEPPEPASEVEWPDDTEAEDAGEEESESQVPDESAFSTLPDAHDASVLLPILEGFRATLGAHAVCVLRQDADAYQIVGTAGPDFARKTGESFKAPAPLITAPRKFTIRHVRRDDLPPRSLAYSFAPGSAVRIAVAPVGATPLILVADTMEPDGLTHPRIPELFERCAEILRLLFYKEDPTRPRHEIIAEEISRARSRGHELALALVLLRNAEHMAELGAGLITQAEELLRERLQAAGESTRVIRFGELMFGVFSNCSATEIEAWNHAVHASLEDEDGILSGGVIIGVAMLSERHTEANDLREAAKAALLSAYQKGVSAVISEAV